ncbi:MAG TPA: serine protease [Streptosporangiaceae bacterium]
MDRVARRAALIAAAGVLAATASAIAFGTGSASAGGHPPAAHAITITGHAAAVTPGQQAGVRRYWTRSRMEHAIPAHPARKRNAHSSVGRLSGQASRAVRLRAPVTSRRGVTVPAQQSQAKQVGAAANGAAWNGGGAIARTTGKVFFTMGGHDYVCSGSTVASANSDVVVTAAHCVKNGTGGWATNWTFVPGFAHGKQPYGSFSASRFYVASQWSSKADNDYDVAFVKVNPARQDGAKVPVVDAVGGQGISFGSAPARVAAFGYPADAPYSGGRLYFCSGKVSPDPYHETDDSGLRCAMTAGSSGGPWLDGFSPAAGTGTITGVSSFKYSTNSRILYGTPLGSVAQQLYQAAEG